MRSTPLVAAIGGLGLSYAQTYTVQPTANGTVSSIPTGTVAPCAAISAYLEEADEPKIPAKAAYDCLSTVPVDVDGDLTLIAELKVFLEWQTNTAYLKDPPRQFGYKEPAVDIMGGLDIISRGVKNGQYLSEYAVQTAIGNLLLRSYDNHLYYRSDIVAVFDFFRPQGLVSVSTDGVALPEVYIYSDLNKTKNGETFTPSPVKTIDGEDVVAWLTDLAEATEQYHDVDARYNGIFPNQANIASNSSVLGVFNEGGNYAGPYTNLTFANGTDLTIENMALVLNNFTGVDSGEAFFSKFCQGPQTADPTATPTATPSETTVPSSVAATATPTPINYPPPVVWDELSLAIGGYYLDGADFEDVAVLSIPAFDSTGGIPAFRNVTRDLIADAKSKGKTKLIVDLRGNPGGLVFAGFEIFKQLFPTVAPYGAGRFRAHNAWHIIGEATTLFIENATLFEQLNDTNPTIAAVAASSYSDFNFEQNLDINNNVFTSFDEMFGPHTFYNDNFTTIRRPDFAFLAQDPSTLVSGYGSLANVSTSAQPFAAEDIVILQDGHCSSTCTIFAELMGSQGGVETIAIGGLPVAAPMQGIGGTKGSRVFEMSNINEWAAGLIEIFTALHNGTAAKLNQTVIGTLAYPTQLITRAAIGDDGTFVGSVNGADNFLQNDTSQTPLEFIYQAADCKLFYTAAQIFDVSEVWKAVATTKWGTGKCVANSTNAPSSVSGNGSPYCQQMGNQCPSNSGAAKMTVPVLALVGVVFALIM